MDHDITEIKALARPMLREDDSFAERIIALARHPSPTLSWQEKLQLIANEIARALPFPKPAYALASIAAIGFVAGMISQPEAISQTTFDTYFYETSEVI